MYSRVLVVSDNDRILNEFIHLLGDRPELKEHREFSFVCSPLSPSLSGKEIQGYKVQALDLKTDYQSVIDQFDLIISAMVQLFINLMDCRP